MTTGNGGEDRGGGLRFALRGELTIERVLADAAERLAEAGVREPRREALCLWASVRGVSPGQAWLDRHRTMESGTPARFEDALRRRVEGVPAAYASRSAAFRTLDLYVDERVLVPRPETEGLVSLVLSHFSDRPTADPPASPGGVGWGTVADIGTGSGCIALSLALEGAFDRVVATDVSEGALRVARRNLGRAERPPLGIPPIEFRCGNLLEPLAGERLSAVVSNPPYVAVAEWAGLDPGVREHEPRTALVSEHDGLDHTQRLLQDAGAVLHTGGLLAIELDSRRAHASLRLARAHGWSNAHVEPDLFGRPRYLLATKESS